MAAGKGFDEGLGVTRIPYASQPARLRRRGHGDERVARTVVGARNLRAGRSQPNTTRAHGVEGREWLGSARRFRLNPKLKDHLFIMADGSSQEVNQYPEGLQRAWPFQPCFVRRPSRQPIVKRDALYTRAHKVQSQHSSQTVRRHGAQTQSSMPHHVFIPHHIVAYRAAAEVHT